MFGFFGSLTTMDATTERSNRQEFRIFKDLQKAKIMKVRRPEVLFWISGRCASCVLLDRPFGPNSWF
jgi:hypothetical protein